MAEKPSCGTKTLLINPRHEEWAKILPLGLAYVAAVLEKNILPVEVIDMNARGMDLKGLRGELRKREIQIVGITSTTPQVPMAWEIAKLVKETNPPAKVALGGVHPSSLPEESLGKPEVDFVIRGEGEVTFLELVRAIGTDADLETVNGLSFRKDGRIVHNPPRPLISDLDDIPFPARQLFPFPDAYKSPMLKGKTFADIMTSRGCPGKCIFCNTTVFGHSFRARSPENVVAEIELLKGKYGVTEFHIADDTFSFDIGRALRICDLIIEKGLDIILSCSNGLRVDRVTKELLERMKRAGCYRVSFGVESGSNEVLKKIGKGITVQQASDAFRMANEAGLTTIAFFMFGNHGENRETMEETIRFAKSLNPDYAQFTITTPFPGSALHNLVEKQGEFFTKDWSKYGIYEEPLFEMGALTSKLMKEMYNKAYREFYLRPGYILRRVKKVRSLGDLRTELGGFIRVLGRLIAGKLPGFFHRKALE